MKWFKKTGSVLLAVLLLAACGSAADKGIGVQEPVSAVSPSPAQPAEAGDAPHGPLQQVLSGFIDHVSGPDGFYMFDSPQGSDGYGNLMYYDYHTLQQRYVCDVPGCTHDAPNCTSYFPYAGGTYAFSHGDYLFISFGAYDDGTGWDNHEQWPSALVRFNKDATDPRVMVTYEPYHLQLDKAYADDDGVYFRAPDGLVRVDIESFEKTVLLPPKVSPNEWYNVANVVDNGLLIEQYTVDKHTRAMTGPVQFFLLDVNTGGQTPLMRFEDREDLPGWFDDRGLCYYTKEGSGEIWCMDVRTGREEFVTDALVPLNKPVAWNEYSEAGVASRVEGFLLDRLGIVRYGDWLFIQGYDDAEQTDVGYAYNLATEELATGLLRHYRNADERPIWVLGESPQGLVVLEEERPRTLHATGTGGMPYSFESGYYIFALISAEDFARGVPNFRTIRPVAYSGSR